MIDHILINLAQWIKTNYAFAPFIALLAGVLTSLTPCSMAAIPLIIGYVSGMEIDNSKKAFRLSLVFALGMSITFISLGIAASLLGRIFNGSGIWFYLIIGVLLILMALQTWGLYEFIPSAQLVQKSSKTGYIGAFISGILGGFFSSPCSTPVLVALMAITSTGNNLWFGVLLFVCYAIGNSFLTIVAGTSIGFVQNLIANPSYEKMSKALNFLLGFFILLLGFYLIYQAL